MEKLKISLFGPYEVRFDGGRSLDLGLEKAQALLAFLAVEAGHAHRRDTLASLLWPEQENGRARANLRQVFYKLRSAIDPQNDLHPPYFLSSEHHIQFNPDSVYGLDVDDFTALLDTCHTHPHTALAHCLTCVQRMQQAVELYRGEFLADLTLPASVAYQEWTTVRQAEFHNRALDVLAFLTSYYEERGELDAADAHAQHQLRLEPWSEEAHHHRMKILALRGQRTAALQQYEACRRILAAELDVEPTPETTALCERIRLGRVARLSPAQENETPVPLATAPPPASQRPAVPVHFVGFENELRLAAESFAAACGGRCQVAIVTGEQGAGKTALIGQVAAQAVQANDQTLCLYGRASHPPEPGDRCRLIQGVVRPLIACHPGNLSIEPLDRFAAAPLEVQLDYLVAVLSTCAARQPLVVALDDLQWADEASITLLRHLPVQLTDSRILFVFAYRSGDGETGHPSNRQLLESAVGELQSQIDGPIIDLDRSDGSQFVSAYLSTHGYCVGEQLRAVIYRRSLGRPLITIEILRDLAQKGILTRNAEGRWVNAPEAAGATGVDDWGRLPVHLETLCAERVGRLPDEQQALLEAAAVQGDEFCAEVAARAQGIDPDQAISWFSNLLGRTHRLVTAVGTQQVEMQRISRYRFRHPVYRAYLVARLDDVRRVYLHEATGRQLAALAHPYAVQFESQIATHYEVAGAVAEAVAHRLRAGEAALEHSAYHTAIDELRAGLTLLQLLPESPERAGNEAAFRLALAISFLATGSPRAENRRVACERALVVGRQAGDISVKRRAYFVAADMARAQGDFQRAQELSEELYGLAQDRDAKLSWLAEVALAETCFGRGDLRAAGRHLQVARSATADCAAALRRSVTGLDVGVTNQTWLGWTLWALGYGDQATAHCAQALTLAGNHPLSQGFALAIADVGFCHLSHQWEEAAKRTETLLQWADSNPELSAFDSWIAVFGGWARCRIGATTAGLADIRGGIEIEKAGGTLFGTLFQTLIFADACTRAGCPTEALRAIEDGLTLTETLGESYFYAELQRVRGEILLRTAVGDGDSAREETHSSILQESEIALRMAVKLAHLQHAKVWELCAATSLCRLLLRQQRSPEARALLDPLVRWFTEGVELPDLCAARMLLEQLA